MKRSLSIAGYALIALLAAPLAHADEAKVPEATAARIKANIERYSNGSAPVASVAKTPVPGVFEVVSGTDVFYVDASGKYAFVEARLIDMEKKVDLTAVKAEAASRIQFADLPLNLAVKTVNGDGRRVIAVFEDPTCPVCKVFHKFLAQVPNLTVYSFPFPVVSPEARPLSAAAWCAKNRAEAWRAVMSGGRPAGPASGCDGTEMDRFIDLGNKFNVIGTPTVFLSDGRRLVGATPPEQFIQMLDQLDPQRVSQAGVKR